MSYYFSAFVFNKKDFDPSIIIEANSRMEKQYYDTDPHPWKSETYTQVELNKKQTAVFYEIFDEPSSKSRNMSLQIESLLVSEFIEIFDETAAKLRKKYCFYLILYSDMTDYCAVCKYNEVGSIYMQISNGSCYKSKYNNKTKKSIEKEHKVKVFRKQFTKQGKFNETAYEKEIQRQRLPFEPSSFLHDETGISVNDLITAYHNIETKGKIIMEFKKLK
jgi:hypothetical protein